MASAVPYGNCELDTVTGSVTHDAKYAKKWKYRPREELGSSVKNVSKYHNHNGSSDDVGHDSVKYGRCHSLTKIEYLSTSSRMVAAIAAMLLDANLDTKAK